jgi:enoyl-CoA hydratase/carnithine racemase
VDVDVQTAAEDVPPRPGVRIEQPADGVALVVLNRPERLNAFDDDLLLRTLPATFTRLGDDQAVRAIVVTGEGRGFSAGADLDCSGFTQPSPTEAAMFVRATHRTPVIVRSLEKPTIAAVNGSAVGAGFGLALACDLRLASADARMGAGFVAMGLVPDYGVSFFLPRVVGTAVALDLLFTGRLADAEEALGLGLVSRICDDVVGDAIELATAFAANPPQAMAMTKRNVYRSMELSLEAEILEQEVRAQALALHGSEFPERFVAWKRKIQG